MPQEIEEGGQRAFSTFRVLNGDANILERDQLFRNMAQLYSYVSDRCDDEQVAQYDEVLCQLAELVEVEARTHVAKLLAPLDRAPGNVVNKLANDASRSPRRCSSSRACCRTMTSSKSSPTSPRTIVSPSPAG